MGGKRTLAAVLAWLLGLGLLGTLTALRVPVSSDLTLFLPSAATPKQHVLLGQLHQGTGNRLLVAAVSGGSLDARTRTSRRLRSRLRGSPHFLRVANGSGTLRGPERDLLFANRYLLSPEVDRERFQPASLHTSLEARLEELLAPTSAFTKELLAQDPTGELLTIVERLRQESSLASENGVWVSPDRKRALMLLYTRAPGTALDAQEAAHAALREAFRQARVTPAMTLELTGSGVFGVKARERIQSDAFRLSLAGSLGVAVLLLVLFRSPRILVLAGLPLGAGVLAGIWVVWAVFGAIHGITIAFGVTLLGVAIDYPLHLFSHIRAGRRAPAAIASIWPTLRLGVVSTVVAYAFLATTDFRGLVQLGLFAGAGLAAAAAVTRWGLPPLSRSLPPGGAPRLLLSRWLRPSLPLAVLLLAAAAGSGAVAALSLPKALERDLGALSPVPQAELKRFGELREQIGNPDYRHLLVATGASRQEALARSEALREPLDRLVREGTVAGYRSPARVLPSVATQRQRQEALPARSQLEPSLAQAAQGLPFRPELFQPFLEDVAAARHQAPLRLADLEGTFLHHRAAGLLMPIPQGNAALIPLRGVDGPESRQAVSALGAKPQLMSLDLKAEADSLILGFMGASLSRLAAGVGVLALVLGLGLRSIRRLMGVALPVGLALVTTIGLLVLLGEQLTVFHVVALLLVFGIGVDYSLFFGRPESDPTARERTLRALATCAASTLLVFGVLATSTIPVLHQTGITVAVGALVSFLLAMVLASALTGQAADRA